MHETIYNFYLFYYYCSGMFKEKDFLILTMRHTLQKFT